MLEFMTKREYTFKGSEINTAEFTNNIGSDQVAYNEPFHLDLHCLPLVLEFSIRYSLDETFLKFCRHELSAFTAL